MSGKARVLSVTAGTFLIVVAAAAFIVKSLYARKTLGELTFEPDYYWADKKADTDKWDFRKT
ncbi:MAG: hypothetical protein KBS64_03515, partial [Treponema sp.]|nr:hypothetical protein [Candidatus Treponema equi]